VKVIASGTTFDGRPFLGMEHLDGRTLKAVAEAERPLPPARIRRVVRQVALALGAAHRLGLVHRDLKPTNIMLVGAGADEVAKVLDFGVARVVDVGGANLTAQQSILGTPRYMAPEQVLDPAQAGPSSDLYSLGVILYELLAGRPPFDGGVMEILGQQFGAEPPALASRTGLEPLAMALLAKTPAGRPASADEVVARLDEGARPALEPRPAPAGAERRLRAAAGGAPPWSSGIQAPDTAIDGLLPGASDPEATEARPRRPLNDLDGPTELELVLPPDLTVVGRPPAPGSAAPDDAAPTRPEPAAPRTDEAPTRPAPGFVPARQDGALPEVEDTILPDGAFDTTAIRPASELLDGVAPPRPRPPAEPAQVAPPARDPAGASRARPSEPGPRGVVVSPTVEITAASGPDGDPPTAPVAPRGPTARMPGARPAASWALLAVAFAVAFGLAVLAGYAFEARRQGPVVELRTAEEAGP
jgi:hypothetical protein